MTRVSISIGILVLLIGIGIWSGVWVDRRCDKMLSRIDIIAEERKAGNYAKAKEAAACMADDWKDFRLKAMVVLKNSKLSEIDRVCSRIESLSGTDSLDTETESAELRHMLYSLKNAEAPYFSSVF
ncbi:MAG: DUF4363 family protein [Ruminococcus flavefaciens]|nr:DUF4363 family protein [Ruminococcus flavefaciens]